VPRLSIQIDDKLDERMSKFLPWGTRQNVVRSLVEMLCDAVEKNGKGVVGLLVNGEFNFITGQAKETEE
jgi:hypothetical protein